MSHTLKARCALLLLVGICRGVSAQDAAPTLASISAGPSIATGTEGALGGVHLGLAVESGAPGKIGLRAEGLFVISAAGTAIPSCVAAPCESFYDPYPAFLYAGSLVLVTPPNRQGIYGLAGGGAYYGAGNKSTRGDTFGATGGASVGAGVAPGSRRFRFELRYHHLFGGLGRLRGVLAPSVSVRVH